MVSNPMEIISSIGSGFAKDYIYCKSLAAKLIREIASLARSSKKASQILKLAAFIFSGLVITKLLCYQSNR